MTPDRRHRAVDDVKPVLDAIEAYLERIRAEAARLKGDGDERDK